MPANIPFLVEELKVAQDEIDELQARRISLCNEVFTQLGIREATRVLSEADVRFHVKLLPFLGQAIAKIILN